MKNYSVLPAHEHVDGCEHHENSEQPDTVEVWLRKKDDDEIAIMVVNPDESTEWLNGFGDDGSIAYEKKDITGLLLSLGYAPITEWQVMDTFGNECVRSFKLITTSGLNEL
jgi:hypothetical protein